MSDNKEEQYGKDFKYQKPKEKLSINEQKLVDSNKELVKKVSILEGQFKAMGNDNRTLRKHMMSQAREMQALRKDQERLQKEIRRTNQIINMMLSDDEARNK